MLETRRIVTIVLPDLLRQTRAPGEEGTPGGGSWILRLFGAGDGRRDKPEGEHGLGMQLWLGAPITQW